MKSSPKGAKENKQRKRRKVAGLKAPDGSVCCPANWLLSGILACVGYNSSDCPRVAPDSAVC
jgi:hypothetical protein